MCVCSRTCAYISLLSFKCRFASLSWLGISSFILCLSRSCCSSSLRLYWLILFFSRVEFSQISVSGLLLPSLVFSSLINKQKDKRTNNDVLQNIKYLWTRHFELLQMIFKKGFGCPSSLPEIFLRILIFSKHDKATVCQKRYFGRPAVQIRNKFM